MEYLTIQELVETAEKKKMSIGAVVLEDQAVQMEQSKEKLLSQMEENLRVMGKSSGEWNGSRTSVYFRTDRG